MKKFCIVFILAVYAGVSVLCAQNVSNREKIRMNTAVLEMLEKYEQFSEARTIGQVNEFVSLFRSPKMTVYNDLIGVSDLEVLPVKEYASLLHRMHDVDVKICNVTKSHPYVSAGSLHVDVSFEKHLGYYDERNVWYSSQEIYGEPYLMTLTLSYDDFDGTCYIESVEGRLDSAKPLETGHLVLKRSSSDIPDLRFRRAGASPEGRYYRIEDCQPIEFGNDGFVCLPSSAADEDWYYMQDMPGSFDPDAFVRTNVNKEGFLSLSADTKHFRARVYNSTTIAGAFAVEGDLDKKFSLSDELGVDVRYMFDLGRRINLGIYGGIGVAYNYLDVAVKDFSYSCQVNKKDRKYDIGIIGQKYSMIDGVLSGGVAFEMALSRRMTMNVDLGGKAYYNLMAKNGNVYSDYKLSYADTTIHVRGHFKAESIAKKMELQPDVWPCPLSAVVGLGFSVNMTRTSLFTFGLEYEHGLNYYYQCEMKPYKEYEAPIKPSLASGKETVQYGFNDSFYLKRRALWLDLGFVFKF